ncbi:MAG: 4-hydroxy-2-oxovalerate aldolase [Thermoproteota archaeon]
MKKIKILDTTLRDGSYVTNFSFSVKETIAICKALEDCGIEFIEIGHGVGLHASESGYGKAKHSDVEYAKAANSSLTTSKYGMFCIPGIARLKDIDLVSKYDIDFLRIGTDVTKIMESEKYIKKAKDYGIFITANYMKSYALSPKKFAEKVKLSEKFGADVVYLVDSAGGMFGEQILNYFKEIRKLSDIPLGFHGHNNLGLAISNSITAADNGFEIIDSSLQGLGRSSGNASTEMLVAALEKRGYDTGINLRKILLAGLKHIRPFVKRGLMPLDIAAGYTNFHTSYMHHIEKFSKKYNIDPISLMIEVTKIDQVNVNPTILEKIASRLTPIDKSLNKEFDFSGYIGGEQDEK